MPEPARRSRVLCYVQHLLGIGHLARVSRIAQALAAQGAEVTVLSGGMPVPGFPGAGVALVQLPPLRAAGGGDFSTLVDAAGQPVDAAFLDARRAALLDAFARLAPDVLVIEAFPFGRRPLRFELLPLLAAAHARTPRPRVVCSVRDIVQASRKPGRAEETVATLDAHFDQVLVHGDPRLCRFEASFPLAARLTPRLAYTGLVAGPRVAPAAAAVVLVSAGGGAVGTALLGAALAARAATRLAAAPWLLLAGPNTPDAALHALRAAAPAGVGVERFRPDFPALLAGAAVSVSQAGYNTVCDVLRAGCRAVLVPYAEDGETEQAARAAHLAARGLAQVPAATDPAALARAIDAALAAPAPPPDGGLDLDGAAASARRLLQAGFTPD
ncbi:putative glycosyltransferase [Plasticicumulans lactativorans]|uniref:Putative glycosyltransferase n=1 Tax=Plasticicumulans lactativorans TaxID=1133106 RepID=A0A4R2KZP4_9GAMM|nr:glycosyltransferase [Plasticicumulans lactativorans]TCO79604.1 putative glycosyltransferase [Plasticicumulans lactativorans]